MNANHKLLDVWLLALCAGCGETIKLTVLERVTVRAIDPQTLTRFHDNDPSMALQLLTDPGLSRRNSITLDWAWDLRKTDVADAETVEISVGFLQRIPIRRTGLLSVGLEVSRSEVQRQIAAGTITSADRLDGTSAGDFSFTHQRKRPTEYGA
ncbi:DUF1062 domain-containing protein [Paractinoplanes durhamensis]|uniref:DUF1062 domain-containing protein n=1 Tax=Paractinoplanes durhamensis TaxID=113563 RepID=UPI001EF31C5C|nr:DUF1062 domain-containing protein [Actinoplanes durhamensis]